MARWTNLTRRALEDLAIAIERSSDQFGERHTRLLEEQIHRNCQAIAEGIDQGYVGPGVPVRRPRRFLVIHPLVIAYNPETRRVLRIVDGGKNFTKLFG